jgi:hypothetical protein
VTSSLVSRPEIFCWVFTGRTPRSLMLFVGQILVSSQSAQQVARPGDGWRCDGRMGRSGTPLDSVGLVSWALAR